MITKNIGGDRLGSGNKLTTKLHGYGRSTHDVGRVFRSTMTQGTLVPCHVDFIQKGDVLDIDIDTLIRTHPTNGPIFGTYKFQVDVFTADIRLYNKQLHNNTTGLGMSMKDVIFPKMILNGKNPEGNLGDLNLQQVAPDSLLAYLGIRGLGTREEGLGNDKGRVQIERNAMPLMIYWDIYKEYYANKQEEIGFVIGSSYGTTEPKVTRVRTFTVDGQVDYENNNTASAAVTLDLPAQCYAVLQGQGLGPGTIEVEYRDFGDITGTYKTRKLEDIPNFNLLYQPNGTAVTIYNVNHSEYIQSPQTVVFRARNVDGVFQYFTWDGETIIDTETEINLIEFPLSSIDEAREQVFEQPKTSPLTIGFDEGVHTIARQPYLQTTGQTGTVTAGVPDGTSDMRSIDTMGGLGVKTYQSDRFNNWLNTTWIERINNISSVDTSTGSFTMDALNLAKKMYEVENRIAVSGGTYSDWLEAVYGEKTHGNAEMPVYRGGMSSEIVFDEVVSSSDATTAAGDDQPLGTLGGRGAQKMRKGGKIRVRAEEHGFLMIIASITPRIDYHQGNKWWMKLETMDDIHKPQLDAIGFQELLTDEAAAWDTKVAADGTETFHSFGKQPSWTHYTTNWNEVYGNFARENAEQWMTLTRRYDWTNEGLISDATTYIDPSKFNYPFAYTELENQPFWVQIAIGVENRRVMSAIQMPNI
ncbi:major capsid protein [Tortoise microvirus 19]|nr:major capsid protein [Tortoise microvirus 19]